MPVAGSCFVLSFSLMSRAIIGAGKSSGVYLVNIGTLIAPALIFSMIWRRLSFWRSVRGPTCAASRRFL